MSSGRSEPKPETPAAQSPPSPAETEAEEAAARLRAYETTVEKAQPLCPPAFSLKGLELLFAGIRLADLVTRPFAGRCALPAATLPEKKSKVPQSSTSSPA